jgi:NADPH:quinone reductase-like Zn-dependent oxidoreductase
MKAVIYESYGAIERLRLAEVTAPRPNGHAVIVDVEAAALNPKDALIRKGRFALLSGRRFPKQTGLDFAGVVRSASDKTGLKTGQRVFGMLDELRCVRGTLAEQVAVSVDEVARLPDALGFDVGAALALTGLTALQALRDLARVSSGARVAIHGASGGVGTIAIQIARVLGAEVLTTSSERNFELCRRLGANETVSYEGSPLERRARELDCIFDVFGNLRYERVERALRPDGIYVTTVPSARAITRELAARMRGRGARLVMVRPRRVDLETLAGWTVERRLEPVIDSRHSLSRFADGFSILESKRARGKIIIDVGDGARQRSC